LGQGSSSFYKGANPIHEGKPFMTNSLPKRPHYFLAVVVCLFFETVSHYVAQADFKLVILLRLSAGVIDICCHALKSPSLNTILNIKFLFFSL
jgi:hypothetical protein